LKNNGTFAALHWSRTSRDRLIGTVVEACAAVLVAAEIVVLFAGVVSRYVFHRPIVWSDELHFLRFTFRFIKQGKPCGSGTSVKNS